MNVKIKFDIKAVILLMLMTFVFAFTSSSIGSSNGVIVKEEQLPIGSIQMWGSSQPPEGWLEMNGQSTAGYSELANIVGSHLPDLRGEFVRGWDNGRGVDAGRVLGSYQADEFKSHHHSIPVEPDGSGGWGSVATGPHSPIGTHTTNSAGGTETRPRNIALMYIIKAE